MEVKQVPIGGLSTAHAIRRLWDFYVVSIRAIVMLCRYLRPAITMLTDAFSSEILTAYEHWDRQQVVTNIIIF